MKKLISLTLSLFIVPLSLVAQDVKKNAAAEQLLKVMNFRQTIIDSGGAGFGAVAKSLEAQNLNEAEMAEVKGAFMEYMTRLANDPKLFNKTAEIYSTNFTEAEIKGLIEFYKTPLGIKTLRTLPSLLKETMKISTVLAQQHVAPFQVTLGEILKRKAAKK